MLLTVNGAEIFVATGGREFDKSLPTVVLLHGAGFDHSTWALHSRWFAHHGFGLLAPDLPGQRLTAGAAVAGQIGRQHRIAVMGEPAAVQRPGRMIEARAVQHRHRRQRRIERPPAGGDERLNTIDR